MHFSRHIVAISEWVKSDILQRYHIREDKISTIYNPIMIDKTQVASQKELEQKYGAKEDEFYYTVAQLIPHKNLNTLIEVMQYIKDNHVALPKKLFISGVNGESRFMLEEQIKERGLEGQVILTGFVEDRERNAFYKYCRAFLFPSVFEGFGMPPIEAMLFGSIVIATDRTCIPEVTQGKANYVKNPYSVEEWVRVMQNPINRIEKMDFSRYDQMKLTEKYYALLQRELGV